MSYSVTVLAPHLVQYHAPIYRALSASVRVRLNVLYQDTTGAVGRRDDSMGADIHWNASLLDGYQHTFLKNWSPTKGAGAFFGRVNPGIVPRMLFGSSDAVLLQGYQSFTNIAAFMALVPRSTKVLFRGEATLKEQFGIEEHIKRAMLKAVFALSDVVFYSVPANEEYFLHYGCPKHKLYPLPCAVDNDFFRQQRIAHSNSRDEIRDHLGFSKTTTVLLLVGRMAPYKGHSQLLQAAAHATANGSDLGIIFPGDGPLRSELEDEATSLLGNRAKFVGFQSPETLSRYYVASDVLTICSNYDPSPKVLNEALNFELPLIVSDCVGQIGDSARHQDNAIVFPTGDVGKLEDAVTQLASDEGLRRRMGARSLALADQYSLKADVDCFLNALDSVIAS